MAGSGQLQQCSPASPLTDLPEKPAQQHIQPEGQLPQTCPLIQCPPKHHLQSRYLFLSNRQLQHPTVPASSSGPTASCIFLRSHFFSSSHHYSLSPGSAKPHWPTPCARGKKLYSHLPIDPQPAPGTQPGGGFPKQKFLTAPVQTHSPGHYLRLSFHRSSSLPSSQALLSLTYPLCWWEGAFSSHRNQHTRLGPWGARANW